MSSSNTIKNISYDQKEILYNIMQLYNNGEPFDCDITASTLKFYEHKKGDKYIIPKPKLLFDVFPQSDEVQKIEPFHRLPIEEGSVHSIVVDLPFVIAPHNAPSLTTDVKDGSNKILKRFGTWYPYMEGYRNMYFWMKECYNAIEEGGIIVWKMQDTISATVQHSFVEFCKLCAQDLGMYVIDEFFLLAKARLISSKIKKQQHARKYVSSFIIIKKDKKLGEKYSPSEILKKCKEECK